MKMMCLMCNRVLQYMMRGKAVFVMFIVGGALNAILFAYLYGNLLPAVINKKSQEIYYRQYTVIYEEPVSNLWDSAELSEIANHSSIESVLLLSYIDRRNPIVTPIHNSFGIVRVEGQVNTIDQGEVILPYLCTNSIGKMIDVFGEKYLAVGRHSGEEYYISIKDYERLNFETDKVIITAKMRQVASNDPIEKYLQGKFLDAHIKTPHIYELADKKNSETELFMMCCVFAIVSISYMFLLVYLIDQNIDENIISILVGAPKSAIVTLVFWEGLILSSISNLIGLLLHKALYTVAFQKINISTDIEYGVRDYSCLFLFMFIITIAVIIPFLRKYTKLSPIQAKQIYL